MKTSILKYVVLFFIGLTTVAACAQTKNELEMIQDKVDDYLSRGIENGFFGAMLIKEGDEVILNKGYGLANKDKEVANTPETIFDIGSNTKQFTGAAILKLVEQGKVRLVDPLSKFFADLPDDKKNITIHQLLTHTSGLLESLDSDFELIRTERFFSEVFNSKLIATPGSSFNYSNIGFSVLARIIEVSSGKSYERFLKSYLFEPAGMTQTGYLFPEWENENFAIGYNRNVMTMGIPIMRYQEAGEVSWHLKGNGGINSTQNDILLWMRAIQSNTILPRKLVEKWIMPHTAELNTGRHFYGYGWGILSSDMHDDVVYHIGGNGAFAHVIMWNVKKDMTIIFATNTASPRLEQIPFEVHKMLLDEHYVAAEITKNPYFYVVDFVNSHSTSDALKLKDNIQLSYKEEFSNPDALNRLGYLLMRSEKTSWAIELFKMNTEFFPENANSWDSLGDGYKMSGFKEEAIDAYRKAYSLDNDMTSSIESLKVLGIDVEK